ncbi:MAG: translation initiation factor IF-2 N-terminal domain-containing protein, partial [Acidimicrobiaceae bacterium]|nr:translation initiation factor IF-2 N-terminal domain-containing protein [Acidimicrobiaceae bacterium]
MPGKIRVHELAKELGLTNQETLELCFALSIGVKSHSSSIVEAQADRVRRRAERDGLLKPPPPPVVEIEEMEEPLPEDEPAVVELAEPAAPAEPAEPAAAVEPAAPVAVPAAPPQPEAVPSEPERPAAAVSAEPEIVKAPPADAKPSEKAPMPKVTISSSGSVAPAKRVVRDDPHPPVEEKAPPRPASQRAAAGAPPARPLRAGSPPVSRSGKPIPPPPPPRRMPPPRPPGGPGRSRAPATERRSSGPAGRPAGPRPAGPADRGPGARRGAPAGGPRPLGGPR